MPVSAYGAQQWAGLMVGLGSLPASLYVALCSDEPGIGWDGTVLATVEPPATSGSTAYARVALGFGATKWALADAGYAVCTVDLPFATPDVSWGSLPYFALTDALTAGNLWAWGAFTDVLTVTVQSTVVIPAGSISVELGSQVPAIAE